MLGVLYTDTFTVELETVIPDSIRTDEQPVSMFGSIIDSEFGRIEAGTFTEFRMTGSNLFFGDSLSLDSIVLDLELSGFYGNYSDLQKLRIFELNENLERAAEYYNTDSVETLDQINLASISDRDVQFNSEAEFKRGLRIRLSDVLGNKILNASSDQLLNNENFRAFFKGLYIGTGSVSQTSREPGAMYYFNAGGLISGLTLYYNGKIGGEYYDTLNYKFVMNDDAARFHKITRTADAGTFYHQVLNNPTTTGAEYLLCQAGIPAYVYVKIPNLRNIFPIAVNKAELEIPVITEYFGANQKYQPPNIIQGVEADVNKQMTGALFTSAIFDVNQQAYNIILSSYTQRMINAQGENNGFLLSSLNLNTNINRVILAGAKHPTRKPKLKLTYTTIPR